jgi:hypothetical protein
MKMPDAPSKQVSNDIVRIELAEPALAGGWEVASRTAELTARLLARPNDSRGVSDSIAFMANEVIENAVKFRASNAGAVSITAWKDGGLLHFDVQNMASSSSANALAQLRDDLGNRDAGELLIERIEANAASNRDEGSGLGVLTLMSDYDATITWEIGAPSKGEAMLVTTRVSLPIE